MCFAAPAHPVALKMAARSVGPAGSCSCTACIHHIPVIKGRMPEPNPTSATDFQNKKIVLLVKIFFAFWGHGRSRAAVYLFHVGLASFQIGKLKVGVKSFTLNVLIKNHRPEYEVLLHISTLVFVNLRSVENSRSPRRINRIAVALCDFASQIK